MRTADYVVTALILVFGCIHSALAPPFHGHYDPAGMWFLSGGLMIVFLALLNLVRISFPGNSVRRAALLANVMALAFSIGLIPLVEARRAPQVPAFAAIALSATLFSLFRREPAA